MNGFVFDFAIPERKIAMECDGKYWHSLPRNIKCDMIKEQLCRDNGWALLRFDEVMIHHGINECVQQMQDVINNFLTGIFRYHLRSVN